MISNTSTSHSGSRTALLATVALVALVVILAATVAYLSANPDPYNADIVANFMSMLDGYGIRGNTIYLPAHTNASKLPQLWLAVQLFGYSNRAIAFTDFVDTLGLYLLTFLSLIWAFRRTGRLLDIALGCIYLMLLSAAWYWWTVHPGLRNIEMGAALLWVVTVIYSRRRWLLVAMVPLGVVLLIGDPWILTAFFVPAGLAVFIDTLNQPHHVDTVGQIDQAPASRWRTALVVWQDVVRVGVIAAAVIGINYLLRAIANASGLFLIINTEQSLQVAAPDLFDRNLATTLQVIGQLFNMWVPGKPMIGLHVIRALGNLTLILASLLGLITGARSSSVHLRRFSLFALISCGMGLTLYLFSNFATDANTGRYLIFLPVAVVIGFISLMSQLHQTRNAWRYILLLILIATIGLNTLIVRQWLQFVRDPNFRAADRQITGALKVLQAEGATVGFAEYWNSLNQTMQLGKAIIIAPVKCTHHRLVPFEWLSQRAWYEPALQLPVTKSFVVMDRLTGKQLFENCTRDDLIAQFGPPAESRLVESDQQVIAEILIWNANISGKVRASDE